MATAYNIDVPAGKSILLYRNGKILLNEKKDVQSLIYTSSESFIGTEEEVNQKIIELGLTKPEEVKKDFSKFKK